MGTPTIAVTTPIGSVALPRCRSIAQPATRMASCEAQSHRTRKAAPVTAEAGSSKSKALAATIWLSNMDTFNEMNEVWDAWIDPDNPPARACVEARLAAPQFTVEIMVTAAVG